MPHSSELGIFGRLLAKRERMVLPPITRSLEEQRIQEQIDTARGRESEAAVIIAAIVNMTADQHPELTEKIVVNSKSGPIVETWTSYDPGNHSLSKTSIQSPLPVLVSFRLSPEMGMNGPPGSQEGPRITRVADLGSEGWIGHGLQALRAIEEKVAAQARTK